MKQVHGIGLILIGIVVGCGAAAVAPVASTWAQPQAGKWECFSAREFPDIGEARSAEGAVAATTTLNTIAAHVPAGTIHSVMKSTGGEIERTVYTCVKY